MSSRIIVTIGQNGNLEADFVAYAGTGCQVDEHRLRSQLARYGLEIRAAVSAKSPEEISEELLREEPLRWNPWKQSVKI